jgi:pyruvate carboxylase subunit B
MAGIGRPVSLGKIIAGIKKRHPNVLIQSHNHSGPGFSVASQLEAARAGADIVDVAVAPVSWGTGHADLLTIHAMLKDAGFKVPDINMKAYMEVRRLTQEFVDDFLGEYINPKNYLMNSLLIGPGLPGGMMGSLMADLESNLEGVNRWLKKNGKPELTQDDLLIKLFDEVEYIWPMLGYPPLVTPYSKYVKNLALMNVIQTTKGKERWSMIADNTWDMILGRNGKLPGEVDEELVRLAESLGKEFFKGDPQDLYPDDYESYRPEMEKNGWDPGEDEEELFELAMHPEQYRNFRSGKAKADFEADLAKRRAEKSAQAPSVDSSLAQVPTGPTEMDVKVNGESYHVEISYGQESSGGKKPQVAVPLSENGHSSNGAQEILAPIEGNFMLTKEAGEKAIKIGDSVESGDLIGYIESMKVYNAIMADKSGKITRICVDNGEKVYEDDPLVELS